MKRFLRLAAVTALSAAMILGTAGSCFAALSVQYDLVWLERNASISNTVTATEGEIYYFQGENGVHAEFGEGEDSDELYISTDADAMVGNHAIYIREQGTDNVEIIKIFVIDKTAPAISLSKSKTGITVTWTPTDAGRYDVQYKTSKGKWKTAAHFVNGSKFTVKGLKKGCKYSFRVRGVNYTYEWGELNGYWSNAKTKTY